MKCCALDLPSNIIRGWIGFAMAYVIAEIFKSYEIFFIGPIGLKIYV
jgi:hypothetical protein